jgi:hypothetical protein
MKKTALNLTKNKEQRTKNKEQRTKSFINESNIANACLLNNNIKIHVKVLKKDKATNSKDYYLKKRQHQISLLVSHLSTTPAITVFQPIHLLFFIYAAAY